MKLFDTHLHLDEVPDQELFVSEAEAAGVGYFLVCGTSLEDSAASRDFAHRFPGKAFFAAGVQPETAESYDGNIAPFRELVSDPACRAVGEIGLDSCYASDTLEKQKKVFAEMLDLALEKDLPAVVHCRAKENSEDAYDACFPLLKAFAEKGGRFEMHCFTGSADDLKRFADLGAYFGVGGILTFNRAENVRELARRMPADRILLETDSPYLAPVPNRGKRNEPKYLPLTARKLAEVKLCTVDEIISSTTENALRFLKIKDA